MRREPDRRREELFQELDRTPEERELRISLGLEAGFFRNLDLRSHPPTLAPKPQPAAPT